MNTTYRVVQRKDGWIIESFEGLDVIIGGSMMEREWSFEEGPFKTKEEAERRVVAINEERTG